jgi:hypothetical protein
MLDTGYGNGENGKLLGDRDAREEGKGYKKQGKVVNPKTQDDCGVKL